MKVLVFKYLIGFFLVLLSASLLQLKLGSQFEVKENYSTLLMFYLFNYLFSSVFILLSCVYGVKLKNKIGFIYLILCFVKIVMISILVSVVPSFKIDLDGIHLIPPFFICLLLEVSFLTQLLKNLKY